MSASNSLVTSTTLGFYHKFSQLRADAWAKLKELSKFHDQTWLSYSRVKKAGIHGASKDVAKPNQVFWIPAFAGMPGQGKANLQSRSS